MWQISLGDPAWFKAGHWDHKIMILSGRQQTSIISIVIKDDQIKTKKENFFSPNKWKIPGGDTDPFWGCTYTIKTRGNPLWMMSQLTLSTSLLGSHKFCVESIINALQCTNYKCAPGGELKNAYSAIGSPAVCVRIGVQFNLKGAAERSFFYLHKQ